MFEVYVWCHLLELPPGPYHNTSIYSDKWTFKTHKKSNIPFRAVASFFQVVRTYVSGYTSHPLLPLRDHYNNMRSLKFAMLFPSPLQTASVHMVNRASWPRFWLPENYRCQVTNSCYRHGQRGCFDWQAELVCNHTEIPLTTSDLQSTEMCNIAK